MKELSKSCLIGRIWTPMDSLYFLRRTILLARLQGRERILSFHQSSYNVLKVLISCTRSLGISYVFLSVLMQYGCNGCKLGVWLGVNKMSASGGHSK